MADTQAFFDHITEGNKTKGEFIILGAAMLDGETITDALVKIPLKTLNRHGLIAVATGTGKTKTYKLLEKSTTGQYHRATYAGVSAKHPEIIVSRNVGSAKWLVACHATG